MTIRGCGHKSSVYMNSVIMCKCMHVHSYLRVISMHTYFGSLILLQVNEKIYNLEREYRDCIKRKRDKIGITRHIMMHQVLYNVHVTLFIGQLHNI